MRSVVAADASSGSHYRLIYNIAERLLYPIASDLYAAPAFQDLLNRTRDGGAQCTPRETGGGRASALPSCRAAAVAPRPPLTPRRIPHFSPRSCDALVP